MRLLLQSWSPQGYHHNGYDEHNIECTYTWLALLPLHRHLKHVARCSNTGLLLLREGPAVV